MTDRTRVVVLGGGMVGGFMARQLAAKGQFRVTLCDRDPAALARSAQRAPLETIEADLSQAEVVTALARQADIVVGAVPGFMGHRTVETVIAAGKPVVDISFFPEEPWDLDEAARAHGVPLIVDCGVMPGLGGMLGLHLARRLERADELTILVGGLPAERRWPTEYKAPFSPIDVIEEYTRPARYKDRGTIVTRPALSEPELVDLPGVGTLEAFNTDGLRSLLRTVNVPTMRERTLRYPGHIETMRKLRELGFFGEQPIEAGGVSVRPLDVTAKLLFREWKLEPGTPELTVMRVDVTGERDGRTVTLRADLLDRTDAAGDASMSRTTGLPAVIAAQLVAEGRITRTGLIPAETLAEDDALFADFLARLDAAGVKVTFSEA